MSNRLQLIAAAPWLWHSIEGSPDVPARRVLSVQFGVLQIFLGDVLGQAQVPVLVILELVADIDQVMSRICVDIIGFPSPVYYPHFARWERFEVLLLLRSIGNNDFEAGGRKQILCLTRTGATQSQS
jgi:hypothetical protein